MYGRCTRCHRILSFYDAYFFLQWRPLKLFLFLHGECAQAMRADAVSKTK